MEINLRAIEISDLDVIINWRNDFELTAKLGGNRFFVSRMREEQWIKNVDQNPNSVRLIIQDSEKNIPLGMVNLTAIDWLNRSAEFSIFIGDANQHGKGIGLNATKLMLEYGFNEINLERIFLKVLESNSRAIALYERVGFKREGLLENSVFKLGGYKNLVLMALLRSRYREITIQHKE